MHQIIYYTSESHSKKINGSFFWGLRINNRLSSISFRKEFKNFHFNKNIILLLYEISKRFLIVQDNIFLELAGQANGTQRKENDIFGIKLH